jgi:hypothetical protein
MKSQQTSLFPFGALPRNAFMGMLLLLLLFEIINGEHHQKESSSSCGYQVSGK